MVLDVFFNCSKTYATSPYSTSMSQLAAATFVQAVACYILKNAKKKLATLRNTFAYKSIDLFLGEEGKSTCVSPKTV